MSLASWDKSKLILGFMVTMLLVFPLLVATGSAADAASHKYASDVSTAEFALRTSGTRASVFGGKVEVGLGIGYHTIQTTHPYPGYKSIQVTRAAAGRTNSVTHAEEKNAVSSCYWDSGAWVGGNATLSCWVFE